VISHGHGSAAGTNILLHDQPLEFKGPHEAEQLARISAVAERLHKQLYDHPDGSDPKSSDPGLYLAAGRNENASHHYKITVRGELCSRFQRLLLQPTQDVAKWIQQEMTKIKESRSKAIAAAGPVRVPGSG
jgi:hypothetical protein